MRYPCWWCSVLRIINNIQRKSPQYHELWIEGILYNSVRRNSSYFRNLPDYRQFPGFGCVVCRNNPVCIYTFGQFAQVDAGKH